MGKAFLFYFFSQILCSQLDEFNVYNNVTLLHIQPENTVSLFYSNPYNIRGVHHSSISINDSSFYSKFAIHTFYFDRYKATDIFFQKHFSLLPNVYSTLQMLYRNLWFKNYGTQEGFSYSASFYITSFVDMYIGFTHLQKKDAFFTPSTELLFQKKLGNTSVFYHLEYTQFGKTYMWKLQRKMGFGMVQFGIKSGTNIFFLGGDIHFKDFKFGCIYSSYEHLGTKLSFQIALYY